jgi:uncharacterized membrane-anchored protein YitT (DUF2179 family)
VAVTRTGTGAPEGPTEAAATTSGPVRHSWVEDVVATLIGTYIASLGVVLLHTGEAVTGGTAGLSLLLSYATGQSFALLFLAVNVPFLALGVWKRGVGFGVRTLISIVLVGLWTELHPLMIEIVRIDRVHGAVTGNLLIGLGMLILFLHNASMGGLNTLALLAQDLLGLRAGYVQLAFDIVIITAALTVTEPAVVAASALGAALLNLVLIMNHRPGRYVGG